MLTQDYILRKFHPEVIGFPDGVRFDITDMGGIIRVCMDTPDETEKKAFAESEYFEIRCLPFPGVLMMLLKFGDLKWMDAPYNPLLSIHLSDVRMLNKIKHLETSILLVDTRTGKLEARRSVVFSADFTAALSKDIFEFLKFNKRVDRDDYDLMVDRLYDTYSTETLVKFAPPGFKI